MEMRFAKKNLTKKRWLELALDILILEGNTKLRINHLVRCVGVTKGSFYWHFKDREEFIQNLVEYWAEVSTSAVVEHMSQIQGSAAERLFELMQFITLNDLTRYDIAIRAWALMEPQIAYIVKNTDEQRISFIHNLFQEMGFEGHEAKMRANTLATVHAMEHGLLIKRTTEERLEMLKLHHEMLTRPQPDSESKGFWG
jgi:AcrR family transcriptional regulator